MTTPPTAAGSTPAPKSLLARAIGVFTSPRDTFGSVAAFPKWFGMLALTTVIVAIFAALPMTTEAGRQAAIDQQVTQMQSFGMDRRHGDHRGDLRRDSLCDLQRRDGR